MVRIPLLTKTSVTSLNKIVVKAAVTSAVVAFFAFAPELQASGPQSSTILSGWQSTSHLGYGVSDGSSTGFNAVAGSLVYLDVFRPLADTRFAFGLRTLAQGGRRQDAEFYRLGGGPLVSVALTKTWAIQGGLQGFRETGLDAEGNQAYKSRGFALLLGGERLFPLTERVAMTWGGFVMHHQGSMEHAPSPATAAAASFSGIARNAGFTRVVSLGLNIWL